MDLFQIFASNDLLVVPGIKMINGPEHEIPNSSPIRRSFRMNGGAPRAKLRAGLERMGEILKT